MTAFSQSDHIIRASNIGLGDDALLVTRFSGTETLSELFQLEVTALSGNTAIAPEAVLGKTLGITLDLNQERHFHGHVAQFSIGEMVAPDLRQYRLTLVPWLWFLQKTCNHRIFQNKNTQAIVSQIFRDHGFGDFEFRGDGGKPREYCIQHNESDLDFVNRLLAEDGLSYFFKQEKSAHTLVIVDSEYTHELCAEGNLSYSKGSSQERQISRWEHRHEYRKGVWTLSDYDFKTPDKNLQAQVTTLSKFDQNQKYEHYEYPAYYRSDLGSYTTKMRMEAEEFHRHRVHGDSDHGSLCAGGRFNLTKHTTESEKGAYVLLSVSHSAVDESYLNQQDDAEVGYVNSFSCIPDSIPIRPAPIPRPVMRGPQSAVVVGPSGEEIYVDDLGRVKVQFIWDREGKKDENSTCFLRVAQTWAGNKWGASFIPRIGHEVIVDFYDGDPDRPFISGSMYNGKNRPPYSSKTLSGIKSRSTKGGSANNYNEIRFDDKSGSEQIYVHAEKDQDIVVENDRREHIQHDRHKMVEQDQYELTKRDHHMIVGKDRLEEVQNSSFLSVARDYVMNIGQNVMRIVNGGEMHRIKGTRTREVLGSEGIDIKKSRSVTVGKELLHKGPTLVYQGDSELTIKGPGGFIKIDSGGVTIVGNKVKINEGGSAGVAEPVPASQPNPPEKPRPADQAMDGRQGG